MLVGDQVMLSVDATLEDGLQASALVTSVADTLRVRLCNTTEGAVDGTSRPYSYIVVR